MNWWGGGRWCQLEWYYGGTVVAGWNGVFNLGGAEERDGGEASRNGRSESDIVTCKRNRTWCKHVSTLANIQII